MDASTDAHHKLRDTTFNNQFTKDNTKDNHDYDSLLNSVWKYQIKIYVDWFVIKYLPLLIKACRYAAKKNKLGEAWEDLLQDTIVEAYKVGERFDPSKCELLPFLIISLKRYPFRNDIVARYYAKESNQDALNGIEDREVYDAANGTHATYSLLDSLDPLEKQFVTLKIISGFTNQQIGDAIGLTESGVRYRLKAIFDKLKVKGNGR